MSCAGLRCSSEELGSGLADAVAWVSGDVAALVGAGWAGPSALAFGQAFEQWRAAAGEVLDGLRLMGSALGSNALYYAGAESDAQARLNAVEESL